MLEMGVCTTPGQSALSEYFSVRGFVAGYAVMYRNKPDVMWTVAFREIWWKSSDWGTRSEGCCLVSCGPGTGAVRVSTHVLAFRVYPCPSSPPLLPSPPLLSSPLLHSLWPAGIVGHPVLPVVRVSPALQCAPINPVVASLSPTTSVFVFIRYCSLVFL